MTSSKQQKMISFWFVMPFAFGRCLVVCAFVCVGIVNRTLREIKKIFSFSIFSSIFFLRLGFRATCLALPASSTHVPSYGISMTTQNTFSPMYCLKSVGLPSHTHDAHTAPPLLSSPRELIPLPGINVVVPRAQDASEFSYVVRDNTFDCHLYGDSRLCRTNP